MKYSIYKENISRTKGSGCVVLLAIKNNKGLWIPTAMSKKG